MAWTKLQLKPGINTQVSRFASEQTWRESQLIRWFQGRLQKLGGWMKLIATPVVGVARGILAWQDLANNAYLIIGTNERVFVYDGGQLEDVTPIAATTNSMVDFSTVINTPTVTIVDVGSNTTTGDWINLITQVSIGGLILYEFYQVTTIDADTYTITAASNATATINNGGAVPSFATTNTFPTVDVTLADHGLVAGDIFPVNVSTAVGGLTITGSYSVTSVTDADTFVITAGSNASSDDTASENGGDVRTEYLLPSGGADPIATTGWGGGSWSGGDWGTDDGSASSVTPLRQWFFSQWGGDALGNPTDGTLYVWIPPYSANPAMTPVAGAPTAMTANYVAMPAQIVFALGAETGGTQDPNLVRWSDVADYNSWTPTVTNQAGSFRIPTGSHIVGGIQGPLQGLIWTDIDFWAATYIGTPFVFGFTRLGQACGLLSGRGMAILGSTVYWIGYNQFYYYANGGVNSIDCTVWDFIFNNLDYSRSDKVFAAANSQFNEIAWYFPSLTGGGEIDSYVKYNAQENLWDYGYLVRTCWTDQSVLGPPIGVDGSGYIQVHETSRDADGEPLVCYARSSYADLDSGGSFWFCDLVEPSLNDTTSTTTLNLSLFCTKTQASPVVTKSYTINANTTYLTTRMRSRFVAFQIGSSDLGSFWRLSTMRFRYGVDGRWG